MPKRPFQVGDRVRVYTVYDGRMEILDCVVLSNEDVDGGPGGPGAGCLWVEDTSSRRKFNAWPKQCRRLVCKERRRITVRFSGSMGEPDVIGQAGFFNAGERVEFIEVKKK